MSGGLLFFSLVIFTLAIGTAIGKTKGRPVAGAIWGLLLGPIGWIIVLIGPNMGPKCKFCGGILEKRAIKCKHCGSTIGFDAQEYERQKTRASAQRPSYDQVDEWEKSQQR